MSETYTEVGWKDGQDGGTPVSAANLKHMDDGIASAFSNIGVLSQLNTTATGSTVEAINEVVASDKTKAEYANTVSSVYVSDDDGLLHVVLGGADSALNFKKGLAYLVYQYTPTASSVSSIGSFSINLKTLFPNDYSKIATSDVMVTQTSDPYANSVSFDPQGAESHAPSISISDGVLTIRPPYVTFHAGSGSTVHSAAACNVHVVFDVESKL